MLNKRRELAKLICYGNSILDHQRWLASEANDLATTVRRLDEIPLGAILPLAELVADGESDARVLSLRLDIDEEKIHEYLDALCDIKFAEMTGGGYKATTAGEQAFDALGRRMITRELHELRARMEWLERIRQLQSGS